MYVYLPDPLIKMVCVQVIAPQKPQKTIKTGFFFSTKKKVHQDSQSTDPGMAEIFPFFEGPLQDTLQLTVRVNPIMLHEHWRTCKLLPSTVNFTNTQANPL